MARAPGMVYDVPKAPGEPFQVRVNVNSLAAALLAGVLIGLLLTPDGRGWLRSPTLLFGEAANASASPAPARNEAPKPEPGSSPESSPEPSPESSLTSGAASAPRPASVSGPAPVSAQAAASAPSPARANGLAGRLAAGRLRIGVFGDSMADGLWSGLYRDLREVEGVTVTRFSEVSTGLSRYDYVDVQAKTRRQITEQPVDVAVILFGTNDAQAIESDGRILTFGSEAWKAAYSRRIDDLVNLLRGRGVVVYWVGLPRMQRESFDSRMTLINTVISARMAALGVPYVDTVALTSNAEGGYEAYLSDARGRRRLMRANDGVHMTTAGYGRISGAVSARLRRDAGLGAEPPAP